MIEREDIMNFFRREDLVPLDEFSEHDVYEILMILCGHSSYLSEVMEKAIENYVNLNEDLDLTKEFNYETK